MRYIRAMITPVTGLKNNENQRGISAMMGAMALFLVNDTLVKWVSQSLPTGQLVCIRGLLACTWLLIMCRQHGLLGQWGALNDKIVWMRGLLDAIASLIYLTALAHLPLANATAINLASPLFILVMAVLFLNERLYWIRTLAAITGFIGVLLVAHPSQDGFNGYAWLAVLGTVMHAGRDVITRKIHHAVPGLWVTISNAFCVACLAGLWSLQQTWVPVAWTTWLALLLSSLCLAGAYHLIIVAMRHGDMGVIAPFRYSGLLYALVLGHVIWGDVPDGVTWLGIGLLVGAGLILIGSNRK
jgi:drug/metabolite transporter (DMT)-like permease